MQFKFQFSNTFFLFFFIQSSTFRLPWRECTAKWRQGCFPSMPSKRRLRHLEHGRHTHRSEVWQAKIRMLMTSSTFRWPWYVKKLRRILPPLEGSIRRVHPTSVTRGRGSGGRLQFFFFLVGDEIKKISKQKKKRMVRMNFLSHVILFFSFKFFCVYLTTVQHKHAKTCIIFFWKDCNLVGKKWNSPARTILHWWWVRRLVQRHLRPRDM